MRNDTWVMLLAAALIFATPALAKESAKDNYRTYCMQCHGINGDGKGINILDMSVQPRDHTDRKSMTGRSDAELFKVIKEGGMAISKSVLMPSWGATLSDEDIHDLVAYLRQLCDCKFGDKP